MPTTLMMAPPAASVRMSPARATQEVSYPCRLLRHAWKLYLPEDPKWSARRGLHLECMRCGMKRHDLLDADNTVATRRYEPPEGYYLKGDEDKPTMPELRKWALRRQHRLTSTLPTAK